MSCGSYHVCKWRGKEVTETIDDFIMPEDQCTCFEIKKKEELRQKTWNSWMMKLIKAQTFDNILSIDNK